MAQASPKTARTRATAPAVFVTLRADGQAHPLDTSTGLNEAGRKRRSLAQEALRWSYVLRARERWLDKPEIHAQHEQAAAQTLGFFGIDAHALKAIAQARQVVVNLRYGSEDQGWEGRVFPWEYVIATATRPYRVHPDHEFTILRELLPTGGTLQGARELPSRPTLLLVQNAPGRLQAQWDFQAERARVEAVLGGRASLEVLANPTLDQLAARVRQLKPDLLHLSGFDNVEGLRAMRELSGPQTRVVAVIDRDTTQPPAERTLSSLLQDEQALQDGMLMTAPNGWPHAVPALTLAQVLHETGHRPFLVSLGVANSAARTAALLVGEGAAGAAVGFQGDLDGALADYFFELLYTRLLQQQDLGQAFHQSWRKARLEPGARNATGIALWSGSPLLPPQETSAASASQAHTVRTPGELPRLEAVPETELNYAVLHNTRAGRLFRKFVVHRNDAKDTEMLRVDVELHLGAEKAVFGKCFAAIQQDRWNLADEIHVPLTADIVRSMREAVNSALVVQLSVDDRVVSRDSHRLRLLPVDQWRDNDNDGQWLPSFVLPRDPAVMHALREAQRFVRVLRDDPCAGFEGYQVAPDHKPTEKQLAAVDLQVQAIWATLLHDWDLGYINPPPTYSASLDSQRLRTPGMVQRGRAGTCIDLALLFAACLELIDIYPVIFLLEGHALPGYWRHHSHRQAYMDLQPGGNGSQATDDPGRASSAKVQIHPWQAAGRDAHRELLPRIRARELVPIETVCLTRHSGFAQAIAEGVKALGDASRFHSMLDIIAARTEGVTPLPLVDEANLSGS